ncbi:MAG: hypothetical protein AAF720_02595 [Pseudomonadota bacterium]
MNEYETLATRPPKIMTKAELIDRLKKRARPKVEPHLSPSGDSLTNLKAQSDQGNERRIARLRDRLSADSERAQIDQAFSRLEGFARVNFENER